MKSSRLRHCLILFFLIYAGTVLWFTVLRRSAAPSPVQTELFYSYKLWLAGDWRTGRQILANIAMFFPFGFFLSRLLPRRIRPPAVLVSAAAFSFLIEFLQFSQMRGLFELDDLISNTLGAMLGLAFTLVLEKLVVKKALPTVTVALGFGCILVCLGVYIHWRDTANRWADSSSRAYCFQVDSACVEGCALTLTGFAFRYAQPDAQPVLLLLASETGEKVPLMIRERIARPDVNAYFSCAYDYTNTGFSASADTEPGKEYEIMIRWPWSVLLHTGVYVTGENVHYAPEKEFLAPRLNDDFVTKGVLRVYRPDYHCWVYQYEGAIYWIADRGFHFEDDGETYIQYQMWTTQIERLPARRLARHHDWDNNGGDFEKYELSGDFGPYRVMRKELPRAYSLTSIMTGYYKDSAWIWKNYFRPIYLF